MTALVCSHNKSFPQAAGRQPSMVPSGLESCNKCPWKRVYMICCHVFSWYMDTWIQTWYYGEFMLLSFAFCPWDACYPQLNRWVQRSAAGLDDKILSSLGIHAFGICFVRRIRSCGTGAEGVAGEGPGLVCLTHGTTEVHSWTPLSVFNLEKKYTVKCDCIPQKKRGNFNSGLLGYLTLQPDSYGHGWKPMFHYKLYGLQHFAALQNQDLTNGVGFLGYHIRNVVNAMVNASTMFGMVPNAPDFRVISCQKMWNTTQNIWRIIMFLVNWRHKMDYPKLSLILGPKSMTH